MKDVFTKCRQILRNTDARSIERKVIDLITSEANFEDVPFEPEPDETVAIDHALGGHSVESDIPEAKYGADAAEELPGQKPTNS